MHFNLRHTAINAGIVPEHCVSEHGLLQGEDGHIHRYNGRDLEEIQRFGILRGDL
jgi:hypothetical protein